VEIKRFTLEEWNACAEEIHVYAFNEIRDSDMNTFDFALMALRDGEPMAYCTCIELDKMSAYMQHGGRLPGSEGTINTAKGYHLMVRYLKEHYKNISTRIRNTNRPMLKLALAVGFVTTGTDSYGSEIYLIQSITGEH